MKYIGVDIGGTKCAVIYGDENGNILKKERFDTCNPKSDIEKIIELAKGMGECEAVGISCGGPLDEEKGIIMSPPNLPGWDDVHITEMLEKELGVPAYLKNDANACAVAEWLFGAGKGCKNMIFLTFGTGLGAGLILNGKLYSGSNGAAGEVGHMRLSEFGPVGYGKRGSFEGFCSGGGIAQLAESLAKEKMQMGKTIAWAKDKITAKTVAEAALAGDETAKEVYDICGEKLGVGLSLLIDILAPDKIVIGSIFQRSEELLRPAMEKVIKREVLYQNIGCEIVPAMLGDSIGDYAALAIAKLGKD